MPTYPQIWYPSGEAPGADAVSGRGAFTRRHLSIQYTPAGASEEPALSISHVPLDTAGLDAPGMYLHAGPFSQGDAFLVNKNTETGAFITGEYRDTDYFSIEGDGDIWNVGTMYAYKTNVGGIEAIDDGTTAIDMTQGNMFSCTPAENTSWSTSAPTNGLGGELACFVVNNSGGYTVAWAAGFTDVDSIAAADTGIHTRLVQFDGTTWHQVAATEDGEATNITISGGVFREVATGNIFGPASAGNDALTGDYNFAAGVNAMDAVTLSNENIAIGHDALTSMTGYGSDGYNIAIGHGSMEDWVGTNSFSGYNISMGFNAFNSLLGTTTQDDLNIGIGFKVAEAVTTSTYATIIGPYAAKDAIDIDNYTILIGASAGEDIVQMGTSNIGIGTSVFRTVNGTAYHNVGVGYQVMYNLTDGVDNAGVGQNSLLALTSGGHNAALGDESLNSITTPTGNVGLGSGAGSGITTGEYNVSIGYYSMKLAPNTITGSSNVSIGEGAGRTLKDDSDKNLCLGAYAGPASATELNERMFIDMHATDTPLVEGDFSGHTIDINGTLSKTAGSFRINHPFDSNKHLYHGFIEGPEYGLRYRGSIRLVDGEALVDIDESSHMSPGIFNEIAQNPTVYLQNTTGFIAVRNSEVENGKFRIYAEKKCDDLICWTVFAERSDEFIMQSASTDEQGHLLLEREKPESHKQTIPFWTEHQGEIMNVRPEIEEKCDVYEGEARDMRLMPNEVN